MSNRLYAKRCNTAGTTAHEVIDNPADVGIRWSLPGGLQKATLTYKPRSRWRAENIAQAAHGQRLIIYDKWCDFPIVDGYIGEVQPDGQHLHFLIGGPWVMALNREYDTTDYAASTTVDGLIKAMLSAHATAISTDQTNIDANATDLNHWGVEDELVSFGGIPSEIIEEALAFSDPSNNVYDFWLQAARLSAGLPQAWVPYYKPRSTSATADWLVTRNMLVAGHQQAASHIWELQTTVEVYYGWLVGTVDATSIVLRDAAYNFVTEGVKIGDRVVNLTTGKTGTVEGIQDWSGNTNAQLDTRLTDGGSFTTGDLYAIQFTEMQSTSASSSASPWGVTRKYSSGENLSKTQAQQLRTQLLNLYSNPVHQQPLVIGGRHIYNGSRARRNLWRTLIGGGYLGALDFDLQPNESTTETAFRITALDYQYRDNTLRIVLSLPDSRLDALLREAGVGPGGESVGTGGRPSEQGGATGAPWWANFPEGKNPYNATRDQLNQLFEFVEKQGKGGGRRL